MTTKYRLAALFYTLAILLALHYGATERYFLGIVNCFLALMNAVMMLRLSGGKP